MTDCRCITPYNTTIRFLGSIKCREYAVNAYTLLQEFYNERSEGWWLRIHDGITLVAIEHCPACGRKLPLGEVELTTGEVRW